MLTGHTEGKKKGQGPVRTQENESLYGDVGKKAGLRDSFFLSLVFFLSSENPQTLMSQKFRLGKWQGVLVR